MNVICLEDTAFYALIEKVVERLREKNGSHEDKWISGDEAMKKIRITSPTTLQKLRDEGLIKFSQPTRKIILYDSESIEKYLEKNVKSNGGNKVR